MVFSLAVAVTELTKDITNRKVIPIFGVSRIVDDRARPAEECCWNSRARSVESVAADVDGYGAVSRHRIKW